MSTNALNINALKCCSFIKIKQYRKLNFSNDVDFIGV